MIYFIPHAQIHHLNHRIGVSESMLTQRKTGGIQGSDFLPIHRAVRKLTHEPTAEIIHSSATTCKHWISGQKLLVAKTKETKAGHLEGEVCTFKKSLKSLPRATSRTTSKTLLSSTRRMLAVLRTSSSERVRSGTGGPGL